MSEPTYFVCASTDHNVALVAGPYSTRDEAEAAVAEVAGRYAREVAVDDELEWGVSECELPVDPSGVYFPTG